MSYVGCAPGNMEVTDVNKFYSFVKELMEFIAWI